MATEKILNVRIKNKIHDYASWIANDPVLLAGEIAFIEVSTAQDGEVNSVPCVMAKVGNGTNKFSELDYLYSKASNVYSWALAKDKPTYSADEITNMDSYIADYVSEQMGIEVDTDTKYQLVKVDDYNYKLQSKGKTDTAWADVADSVIVIPNDTAAIEALEDLVGDTKVATQISNAITELDLANTYEAKGEAAKVQTALDTYKTSNDKAVADNKTAIETETATARAAEKANADAITAIKDGTTIDSFADVETALAGKQASGDYATKTEAQGYADAKDEAIAAAKKAGDDAAEAAATAQGEIDALEEKVGTVPDGQTVMGIITNIQENAYDDTTIKADIKANSDAIDALETKVGEKPVAEQISTAIANEKLAETYAAKVHKHEIADVNGLSDAIADAKAAGTAASTALGEYQTTNDAAVKANADAIDAVEATIGTVTEGKTVVEMIADAQTAATYDDTALAGRVTANEGAIATLNGEGAGSVKKTVDDALNDFATKVSNDGVVNTYKELVDYAAENGSDMATLTGKISTLETTVGKAAEGETAATGLVKDVADLETKVGDKTVSEQITDVTNPLAERVVALEAVDHDHSNKTVLDGIEETDVAAWDAKVDDVTAAADSGLKATRTGNTVAIEIDDSLTFIFDCGNSGVTAE
jgi:hypothetical protein